jgi:hypothetical protein
MPYLRPVAILLLLAAPSLHAQSVTGQISGTVADSSDTVIAGIFFGPMTRARM